MFQQKSKFYKMISIDLIIAFSVIIFLICASWQPKLLFNKDTVKITGMLGMTLYKTEIASVSMSDAILPRMYRTSGLCLFGINKGYFRTWGDGEVCKLYTQSNKPPFILIKTIHSQFIFINFKNKELMEKYYLELQKYGNSSDN
jgi:hypothetical protein